MADAFHPDIFIGGTSFEEMHFPENWLDYWCGPHHETGPVWGDLPSLSP